MSSKKVDSVTGEVVVADVVAAAVEPTARQGDVISRYLREEVENTDVASVDTHAAIVEEIFNSQSLDELLDNTEPESLKEYVGRVITIRDYKIQDSEFEGGAPIYMALKVTDEETGERRIVTTGEQNVIAQLITAKDRGWLPLKCRPFESRKPNKHGRYLIRLGKADD